jgi:hypothetical protein
MTRTRWLALVIVAVTVALAAWALTAGLERLMRPAPESAASPPPAPNPADVPHIAVNLFLASPEGDRLVVIRREVPLAASVADQGREIITAQLAVQEPPLVSPIPPTTSVRAFYVSERGEAFVDLSADIVSGHPGGSTAEMLTVYALVNAVVTNLPSVRRVQLLVDGKEVDTLAGHVDLRRMLERNDAIVVDASPQEGGEQ